MESVRAQFARGFTLIELLLVIAIISVVTAVTLPNLVKSMRGNRLRSASRVVVTAGRYARSMAVLKQEEMAVTFDIDGGKITVNQAAPTKVDPDRLMDEDMGGVSAVTSIEKNTTDSILDQDSGAGELESDFKSEDRETVAVAGGATGEKGVSFTLDRVRIEYVELTEGEKQNKGKTTVLYRSNGTCAPYSLKVVDEYGSAVTVDVDALSSAKTEGGS